MRTNTFGQVWAVLCIPAGGVNLSINRCHYLKARPMLLSGTALAHLKAVELHPLAPLQVLNH